MNKKRYSLMLINMDRGMHLAYKRMMQPGYVSTYGNNKCTTKGSYYKNTKGKNNKTINTKPRSSAYEDFLLLRNQSMYPFGLTEKRFKWQNLEDKSNPISPDDYRIRLKRIPVKSCFEGGFGNFFTKDGKKLQKNKSAGNLSTIREKNYGKSSQRVILPEKNQENPPRKGKKIQLNRSYCEEGAFGVERKAKTLTRSSSTGSITSLIDKTPLVFEYRGKKMFPNSPFVNKGSLNLFDENYNKVVLTTITKSNKRMHYNDVIC